MRAAQKSAHWKGVLTSVTSTETDTQFGNRTGQPDTITRSLVTALDNLTQ